MEGFFITTQAAISVACWFIASMGAAVAVFSRRIEDTVTERIGLAAISVGTFGTGCRIIKQGWVTDGGMFLAVALAFYVCALFWKHLKNVRGTNLDKAM